MAAAAAGRVVIAGGTGLIGGALARALGATGRDVVVLTRRRPEETPTPPGCRAVRWDARTGEGWAGEADGAAAIVNLAGESISGLRWTEAKKRKIAASRSDAVAAVRDAIERARVRPAALLQASAIGYYGDRGDEIVDESSSRGGGFLARTTSEWERASEPIESLGVRRVLLRTALVLARDGGALPAMARPFRFGLGGRTGSGRQWMPWIHLEDEVAAIAFLLEREEARGAFVLAAPEPVRNADFARALGRALRRPAVLPAPAFVLRALLGEMSILLLGSQRAVARRLPGSGFRYRYPELEAALADLVGPSRS